MLFVGNTALAWTDVLATLQVELQIINCVTHFSCTENCIKLYDITFFNFKFSQQIRREIRFITELISRSCDNSLSYI